MKIEIRDNAIHYFNKSTLFEKRVMEIGTASLHNYMLCIKQWFERDLSQYNFFLMPLSFFHLNELEFHLFAGANAEIRRLLNYIHQIEGCHDVEDENGFSVLLRYDIRFSRKSLPELPAVNIDPSNPNAIAIKVEEDSSFKTTHILMFEDLITELRGRYTNFKQNNTFYKILKDLRDERRYGTRYCRKKYLRVDEQGAFTYYYSKQIIREFDKYYTIS